jgi:hypothetical protein
LTFIWLAEKVDEQKLDFFVLVRVKNAIMQLFLLNKPSLVAAGSSTVNRRLELTWLPYFIAQFNETIKQLMRNSRENLLFFIYWPNN